MTKLTEERLRQLAGLPAKLVEAKLNEAVTETLAKTFIGKHVIVTIHPDAHDSLPIDGPKMDDVEIDGPYVYASGIRKLEGKLTQVIDQKGKRGPPSSIVLHFDKNIHVTFDPEPVRTDDTDDVEWEDLPTVEEGMCSGGLIEFEYIKSIVEK